MAKLKITNRYGIVPNDLLNSQDISLRAKGLFAYLQSKPDNWTFSTNLICSQTQEGRDAIRTTLQELEKHGYLQRLPKKTKSGKWAGYDYVLNDQPSYWKSADGESVLRENRTTDVQEANSKKDSSKKDSSKKKQEESASAPPLSFYEQGKIIEVFNKTSFPKVQKLTAKRKKAISNLVSKYGIEKIKEVFEKANRSNFLRGNNTRGFVANFDWIMTESNFVKTLEGNYANSISKPIDEPKPRKREVWL